MSTHDVAEARFPASQSLPTERGTDGDDPTSDGASPDGDPYAPPVLGPFPDSDWAPRSRHDPQPTLAETPARGVEWLWPGRIPLGRVTLLVGDPGVGKSLLALDIAARTSAALPWPDEEPRAESIEQRANPHVSPPVQHLPSTPAAVQSSRCSPLSALRSAAPSLSSPPPALRSAPPIQNPISKIQNSPASVLILSAEDDPADTIRPRLAAMGADLSRVVALPPAWSPEDPCGLFDAPGIFGGPGPDGSRPRSFDLRRDVGVLEKLLAERRNVRLVILDPLSGFLGRNIENFNYEVRQMLTQLGALAARQRVAVLAICHLRKQRGAALHRTMGSLAFAAVARAAWLVAKDPADGDRRLMLPMKNNLAADVGGLAFTIHDAEPDGPPTPTDGGLPRPSAPVLRWSPTSITLSADDSLDPPKAQIGRPSFERDDAVRWLRQALDSGARPADSLQREAEAHGLSRITVRRAFRELGGEAVKSGYGPLSQWYWRLPGVGVQEPQPTLDHLWPD